MIFIIYSTTKIEKMPKLEFLTSVPFSLLSVEYFNIDTFVNNCLRPILLFDCSNLSFEKIIRVSETKSGFVGRNERLEGNGSEQSGSSPCTLQRLKFWTSSNLAFMSNLNLRMLIQFDYYWFYSKKMILYKLKKL